MSPRVRTKEEGSRRQRKSRYRRGKACSIAVYTVEKKGKTSTMSDRNQKTPEKYFSSWEKKRGATASGTVDRDKKLVQRKKGKKMAFLSHKVPARTQRRFQIYLGAGRSKNGPQGALAAAQNTTVFRGQTIFGATVPFSC